MKSTTKVEPCKKAPQREGRNHPHYFLLFVFYYFRDDSQEGRKNSLNGRGRSYLAILGSPSALMDDKELPQITVVL